MPPDTKSALQAAAAELLDPLIRLLIETGVQVGDFESLVRIGYARVGRQIIREAIGETNNSRIHIITGIPRKDLPKLLVAVDREFEPSRAGRHRCERVLAGWYNDAEFQTRLGSPAALPFEGERRSFAALCKRYGGDSRIGSLKGELLRVGAIRERTDGKLEPLRRDYANVRWKAESLAALGEQIAEHIGTLAHNLQGPEHPRFVQRPINIRLRREYLPLLRRQLEDRLTVLADHVDHTLNHPPHTADRDAPLDEVVQLGVSIQMIEKPAERAPPEHDSEAILPTGRVGTRAAKTTKRKK